MIRGQRFELDLSDDEHNASRQDTALPAAFVGDVLERKPAAPKPPSAPVVKSRSGFPEHKKRPLQSRFKQQKAAAQPTVQPGPAPTTPSQVHSNGSQDDLPTSSGEAKTWEQEEKERIDRENRERLAQMSPEEIEEERRELLQNLSPALVQRLLQKSTIDSGSEESDLSRASPAPEPEAAITKKKPGTSTRKAVTFADDARDEIGDADADAPIDPPPNEPEETTPSLPPSTIHFPRAPQPPSLDPNSPSFLTDLHEKYFPSLPSDPSKLSWMQSSSPSDPTTSTSTSYSPSAPALSAAEIRFSFTGALLPPRLAAEIPVTAGLHHHGDAPDAAGYTVAELAHLARSSYAAQRCIAFQTLGRILYRLGQGEFGDAGEPGAARPGAEDTFGELARGLWREVDRLAVVPTLVDESEGRGVDGGRHVSARAYATEAVWLWRKGGGRRWAAE